MAKMDKFDKAPRIGIRLREGKESKPMSFKPEREMDLSIALCSNPQRVNQRVSFHLVLIEQFCQRIGHGRGS